MKGNPGRVTAAQPLSQVSYWALEKLCLFDKSGQMRSFISVQKWGEFSRGAVARKEKQATQSENLHQKTLFSKGLVQDLGEGLSGCYPARIVLRP